MLFFFYTNDKLNTIARPKFTLHGLHVIIIIYLYKRLSTKSFFTEGSDYFGSTFVLQNTLWEGRRNDD